MDVHRDPDGSAPDRRPTRPEVDLLSEALLGSRRSMFFFALTVFVVTAVQVLSVPLMALAGGVTEWDLGLPEPAVLTVLVVGCALQAAAVAAGVRRPRTGVAVVAAIYLALAVGLWVPSWLTGMYLVVGLSLFLLATRVTLTAAICWTLGIVLGCMAVLGAGLAAIGTAPALMLGYIAGETARFAAPAVGGAALGAWWAVRMRHLADARAEAERVQREHEGRVFAAQARERERIAQELHDVAGQHLAGLVTLADAAVAIAPTQIDRALGLIEEVRDEGRFAAASLAGALTDLRAAGTPVADGRRDLREVDDLIEYWRQRGMQIEVVATGDLRELPAIVTSTGYRALQEALTNAAKHAPGAAVTVAVRADPDAVELDVRNDAPAAGTGAIPGLDLGWGLAGMRDRIALLDGVMAARATPDGGWALTVRMPLTRAMAS